VKPLQIKTEEEQKAAGLCAENQKKFAEECKALVDAA
jgi:hypothetical protein